MTWIVWRLQPGHGPEARVLSMFGILIVPGRPWQAVERFCEPLLAAYPEVTLAEARDFEAVGLEIPEELRPPPDPGLDPALNALERELTEEENADG